MKEKMEKHITPIADRVGDVHLSDVEPTTGLLPREIKIEGRWDPMTKLPRKINNDLGKAKSDLEWAVRMMHDSVVPNAVDVDRLCEQIGAALRAAQTFRSTPK